jgi:GNAT superfamily N-acetyltransferase
MAFDVVAAGALNIADWHDACLGALRVSSHRSSSIWLCTGTAPFIFLTAITLNGDRTEQRSIMERLAGEDDVAISVCDCWSRLDLHDLGFEKFEEEAWYVREPGKTRLPKDVERVREPADLAEFEHANTDGFETTELHDLGRFGVYGQGVLDDPRLHVFVRREGGRVVSGAMACVSAGVVGVYSVATVPAFRRRGFGEEVTWAAIAADASLPAILQPSPEGAPLYRRMGFVPVGRYTKWLRLP